MKISWQMELAGRMRFRIAEMEGKGNPGGQKSEPKPGGVRHTVLSEK